jgi:hypothetical protein
MARKFEMDHDVTLHGPSNEELCRIYEEKMRLAQERQRALSYSSKPRSSSTTQA